MTRCLQRHGLMVGLVAVGLAGFGCNGFLPPGAVSPDGTEQASSNADASIQIRGNPLASLLGMLPLVDAGIESKDGGGNGGKDTFDSDLLEMAQSSSSSEVVLYVDDATGSDAPNDPNDPNIPGSTSKPFKTINRAVEELAEYGALLDGATIYVEAGTYEPFAVSNIELYHDSALTIEPNGEGTVTIDGDGETAITITSAGTIVVAGINVTDADTGIFVVNSIAILINISVDDTDSFALEGVDSTIAVMGSFDVGTTSACASGVHIMDCEVLAGLSDATTWDIDIDGDGGHGLWLQGSSLSTYPSSSFEVAAMGASSNSAILVDEESSLWFDGDLAVETPNNDSDGIEVVNSSYLWLMSPSVTIEGSNSPGTNGLRVERSASASLYPNNPSGTAEWTIDGYGRSGIVSGACSAVYLAYLTNGTLTITGALFGSETGAEYESAAGIWIPASSVFEETPSAPNAVGVTTIRDFQHAVALESESLCIIKRMQASLPGLSDPNKLQGDNDTSAFLSWDSRLDIETLVQGDGASSMCEGFSKLAVISGQTEAVIGLGSDPNFRYPTGNGVSSSGSYIIVLDGGHLTLRSDDIAYFNSDETAATCVYGSENAYIDLSGMCMCLQGFRNGFVLDDGASCRADLVLVFSDANDTGRSCFASLNHGSSAQFWFRMGMGLTANNGYAVLCEALNGSEADLDLQGTFQKKPTTGGVADSMVVARYGSHVRMTGHISEDPNHPGDPNYFAAANLVVSDPNDENHLEARMDSSILSGDYVEQGSVCWNDLTFNGSSTPMVINGTTVSTGFDPNEACYISE